MREKTYDLSEADEAELEATLDAAGDTREEFERHLLRIIAKLRQQGHAVALQYDSHGRISALQIVDA